MDIKIKYQDIIDRCEKLSSFEADGKVDANGKSRYLDIHINEVDKLLITDYIKQAQALLEERMEKVIRSTDSYIYEPPADAETAYFCGAFYDIVPDTSEMQFYEINNESTVLYGGEIVFMKALKRFAYRVVGRSNTTSGYTVYTDISTFGSDYVHTGVGRQYYNYAKKGVPYNTFYTWNEEGNDLVEYDKSSSEGKYHDALVWYLRTDTRLKENKLLQKHITEAIVSYTMAAWLRDRLDERVAFYENLFNNTLALAVKNIFTKQAPIL